MELSYTPKLIYNVDFIFIFIFFKIRARKLLSNFPPLKISQILVNLCETVL